MRRRVTVALILIALALAVAVPVLLDRTGGTLDVRTMPTTAGGDAGGWTPVR